MKKWFALLTLFGTLAVAPQAFGQVRFLTAPIDYGLTTDILWLANKDIQFELASTLSSRSVWTARFGYTTHRAGQGGIGEKYGNNKGRWYLGFRWRGYLLARAPHLLFIGAGWDNRPQDSMIAPMAEVGATVSLKPATITLLYSAGYEFYIKHAGYDSRFVHGPELRVGICF
ncbi:MAG TPA: hypothetical protein VGB72_10530 [Acidobacteriota bacterium]